MDSITTSRTGKSNIELLERDLYFKQLQINRVLEITQAINNNFSVEKLFDIYRSILSWEMSIKKMAFYFKKDGDWTCATSIGMTEEEEKQDISEELFKYSRMSNLLDNEHPLLSQFDIVIPVYHKNTPISFNLLGELEQDEEMYEKIRFVTTITNIIAVAIENKRLFKQQIQQERLKREMEIAKGVQNMLIPSSLPSTKHYELDSIYMPHLGVGGDYFDYVPFGDKEFAFCIGDITGKGVAAALLMANFQANLQTLVQMRLDKKDFIQQLNQKLLKITKGEKFITFFYGEYCIESKKLTYINAGHNPPILVKDGSVEELKNGCTILGIFDEIPAISVGEVQIENDALLVTYTDGLTDLQNNEGDYFEIELLQDYAVKHAHYSAKEFNATLMQHLHNFKGNQPFPDDFSMLTCRFFK